MKTSHMWAIGVITVVLVVLAVVLPVVLTQSKNKEDERKEKVAKQLMSMVATLDENQRKFFNSLGASHQAK